MQRDKLSIGLFTLNNTAVNVYYMLMLYIAYFAAGVLGLGVAVVSGLIATMVIFDGLGDPVIGMCIDRFGSKRLGKFRPFMIVGNVTMAFSLFIMYIAHGLEAGRFFVFVLAYTVFVLGYSCQFCCTRAAQTVLTKDPKLRPLFSAFDMVLNVLLYVGITMAVSNFLVPRHGGFTREMFAEFFVFTAVLSAVLTALAVVGIWRKDKPENFPAMQAKIKLSTCLKILRENRNVQMLMIVSSTDKLFSNITQNAVVTVMLYGIIVGDFALSGQVNMFVFVPSMIVSLLCVQYARKKGQKEALLFSTYGGILFTALIFLLFVFGDPATLSFAHVSVFTVLFMAFLAMRGGFMSINNSITVPMVADCIDYEVTRSQHFAPGTIGALFSFADKIVTSFNTLIIGGLLLVIGFGDGFPTVDTEYSRAIFWVVMLLFCGLPMLGWVVNIVCLRRYGLDRDGMRKVRGDV